jgi:hypothetical protein
VRLDALTAWNYPRRYDALDATDAIGALEPLDTLGGLSALIALNAPATFRTVPAPCVRTGPVAVLVGLPLPDNGRDSAKRPE